MVKIEFFLNDNGILEIDSSGNKTASSIQASAEDIFALAKELRDAGKPVLILDDISQMGEMPPEAHKTFADITKAADFDRFALVGSDNIVRLGINLIAQSIGQPDKLKYFDSRDEAMAWLLGFKKDSLD